MSPTVDAAKWSLGGVPIEPTTDTAGSLTPEEHRQRFEEAYAAGELFSILGIFADQMTNRDTNDIVAEMLREKIRSIVEDPETAEMLCPKDYPFGTKRPCLDTGYYETFNLPHVRLVDLHKHPIASVTETGIDTVDESFEFDAIVYATGFDAMTGAIVSVDITGRDGVTLKDKWAHGATTYLGLTTTGFPNLFMITGPGSPSVLSNMTVSIEQHVDWVADQLETLRAKGFTRIEPTAAAEAGWVQHVNDCADITLFPTANSWYMGANVPGKPRVFLPYIGGVDGYRAVCDEVVERDYLGFELSGPGGTQCNDGLIRRLQPDVAAVLDLMAGLDLPPIESMSADEARAFMAAGVETRPPGPEVGEIVDGVLPGAAGPLDYRLYRPASHGPHPIVAYFHGGGWVLGTHDSDDPFCRDLCVRSERRDRVGQLPPRARRPLPRRGGGCLRRGALDRRTQHRARRDPGSARGRRLERRWQPRRGRDPSGPRRRRTGDRRPAPGDPGDRQRSHHRLVHGQRRGLRADQELNALVLGPLRGSRRPRRPPGVAVAHGRRLGPAPGVRGHVRVRPATRRRHRLRERHAGGRGAGAVAGRQGPHAHIADDGRRDPLRRTRAGADGRSVASVLRRIGSRLNRRIRRRVRA